MYTNIQKNEMIITTDMEDGEVVCLDVTTGEYFGLKELGLEIWNMLSEVNNENDIINRLKEEYDIPEDQIRMDIREYLCDLEKNGLITLEET